MNEVNTEPSMQDALDSALDLAVREFAQANSRHGHIDAFSGYRTELSTGAELHRYVQEKQGGAFTGYKSEVHMKAEFAVGSCKVKLTGRIDGLYRSDSEVIIEEIKSTGSIERLKQALDTYERHPYRLQVQTYAYLYFLEHGEIPRCRLRLISSLTKTEAEYDVDFILSDFESWRDERVAYLLEERKELIAHIQRRRAISERMEFPFKRMRTSQEQLIADVGEAVAAKKHLLVQAPTGLGKTAAVSYPALKDALRRGKQLVYVTPKNSQHKLAEEVVERLRQQDLPIQSLLLTAKSKVCMQAEPVCSPELCEYARNYYDKLSEHRIIEKLKAETTLNADIFREYAERYKVCPFELSLEMTQHADVVVGDYNYVFSPKAAIMRLQVNEAEENLNNNLVIDEAHNLPQRLCDYLSPELRTKFFDDLEEREEEIPEEFQQRWRKLLRDCRKIIMHHAPDNMPAQGRVMIQLDWELFFDLERRINSFLMSYFEAMDKIEAKDPAILLQRAWGEFVFVANYEGSPYFATLRRETDGETSLKITCCDASLLARDSISRFQSVVGFSATFKPFEYFAKLSGFNEEKIRTAEFTSPFPSENRKVMIIPQVSTRFRDRDRNLSRIGDIVRRVVQLRKGNYFIFFPSYDFLARAAPHLHVDGYRILRQEPYMSHKDAEDIIKALQEQSRGVLVLAVQGGVFSEGVDYPGDVLIGAFVVGPGLPAFEFEREQLRKYYDERFGKGFEFAYVYPGMTRVIQAAGRVIRTEEDRGLIILIDDRFLDPMYAGALPQDWFRDSPQELTSQRILADLGDFWGGD